MSRRHNYSAALASIATKLDSLREALSPRVEYHPAADALFWLDEIPSNLSADVENALRVVFRYRTSLALGEPDERCKGVWELAQRLFPKWIGFSPSRVCWAGPLIAFYRKASDEFITALTNLFDSSPPAA